MTFREFILLLISVLSASCGQFLLKLGALKLGRASGSNVLSHVLSIALTPELVAGLTMYGLSAVFYILLLTRVDLSVAGPAVALGYVFSVLMGHFLFQEPIFLNRIFGLGFVVLGVVLLIWKK
jgi:multidrug transporter EmrE-like cation transporter